MSKFNAPIDISDDEEKNSFDVLKLGLDDSRNIIFQLRRKSQMQFVHYVMLE